MAVNRDKPDRWKKDIARSVDLYNDWFLRFAPDAYRTTRLEATKEVERALKAAQDLTDIGVDLLTREPSVVRTLRMSACPPLAVDRLIGLAGVSPSLVRNMERGRLPPRLDPRTVKAGIVKIADTIGRMADPDIFVWLARGDSATRTERRRAASIIADRLCGALANPIIRNAQERRQLDAITSWLKKRGYVEAAPGTKHDKMPRGTFALRLNVPVEQEGSARMVNIPVDAVVMPRTARGIEFPLLFEAKSAGDYANVNKRRKEEAAKFAQLRRTYGQGVQFVLLLCGYFDTGYLGYEAAEGIDWVWEHRLGDLQRFRL